MIYIQRKKKEFNKPKFVEFGYKNLYYNYNKRLLNWTEPNIFALSGLEILVVGKPVNPFLGEKFKFDRYLNFNDTKEKRDFKKSYNYIEGKNDFIFQGLNILMYMIILKFSKRR